MSWLAVSALLASVSNVSIGAFVLSRGAKSPRNTFFACMTFCLAIWASVDFLIPGLAADHRLALRVDRISYLGASFVPFSFLCFGLWLTERPSRTLALGSFGISTLFAILSLTPLIIADVRLQPFREVPGPVYPVFVAFFAACLCYGLWIIWRTLHRSESAYHRNQLRYVWAATAAGLIALVVYALFTYRWSLPPIHYLIEIGVVLTLAVAIIRHRLMDVNVVLTRMALFLLVYVPLLILPFWVGNAMEPVLAAKIGPNWWTIPMVFEALAAVGGLIAYRYVRQKAEDRILAEQLQYQKILAVAAEGMLKILNLRKLLRRIVAIMVKYVHLQYAAVYLQEDPSGPYRLQASCGDKVALPETFDAADTLIHYLAASEGPVVTEELKRPTQDGGTRKLAKLGDQLARMKASVVVPAFLKDTQLLGFLVLGTKLSGQMFTSDDLRIFNALAHQAAIAVQNAHLHRHGVTLGQMAVGHEQLAAWGHEMGNVLHIGTIQVGVLKSRLRDTPEALPKEKMIEQLDHIEKALIRGHHVIEDVKEYLRCTEERGLRAYPLAQFIAQAVKKLQERFEDFPNIQVALDLPDNLPAVEGLATLSLLPLNLLAIPFWGLSAHKPGGTITVKALTDAQRSHVELVVSDNVTDSLRKHMEDSLRPGEESLFPTRSRHGAFYFFAAKKTLSDHGGRLVVLDGAAGEKGTTLLAQLPVKYTPPKPEGTEDLLEDAS